jgi:type II secretory pathway component PulL
VTGGQGTDWMEVAGAIGLFLLVTTVITVTIWQLAATWRAKAALGREEVYRKLAEDAVRAQESVDRKLSEVDEKLRTMDARLATLERILKDVE